MQEQIEGGLVDSWWWMVDGWWWMVDSWW